MTYTEQLQWIKTYCGPVMRQAIAQKQPTMFVEDWLGSITCRESGIIISRLGDTVKSAVEMCPLLKGDYSQRSYDSAPEYHGFGFTQIDSHSYPDFINSGKWEDPLACYLQTIDVLRSIFSSISPTIKNFNADIQALYITAAYNCGAGNEEKILFNHIDPDAYTTGHNYAAQIASFRKIYLSLE